MTTMADRIRAAAFNRVFFISNLTFRELSFVMALLYHPIIEIRFKTHAGRKFFADLHGWIGNGPMQGENFLPIYMGGRDADPCREKVFC